MTIKKETINKGWILVLYDVSVEANSTRNKIREKIREFGGYSRTASCYVIPERITTMNEIENWGKDHDVDLVIFRADLTEVQLEDLESRYKKHLKDDMEEYNHWTKELWDKTRELEEDLKKDPEGTGLRGLHQRIAGIDSRHEEIHRKISRFGDENIEFEFQKITKFTESLKNRIVRLKEMKLKQIESNLDE